MDVSVTSGEEDGPRDDVIESMLRSAVAALKLGMFEDGKGRLEEIMECGTNNFQLLGTIYMYYGRVCSHLKHDAKALEFFENELNIFKLTFKYPEAYDSSLRIVEQAMKMGKFSRAKRCAEDLIDYTSNKKESEKYARKARILLASVCLAGYERNVEMKADEKRALLTICNEQICAVKQLNEDNADVSLAADLLILEAKCYALENSFEDSRNKYNECIDFCIKTEQFAKIHRAYFEKAGYAQTGLLFFIINDLRSAVFYASKYGSERDVAKYKLVLSKDLLAAGNPHEAYLYGMEALESIRNLNSNEYLKDVLLNVSKCLISLGKQGEAAYFIVLGSILTINQRNIDDFYILIDDLMTKKRKETSDGEVMLELNASSDATAAPNATIETFVIKLEHTTNVETWKMTVNGIIEDQKASSVIVDQKENEEPIDFMDLICKMNSRMDDQRTELPAPLFLTPRPLSTTSKKTIKSHRILPGLRANLQKMHQSMKFDNQTVNRILKRSKKSKSSLHSNSTQGDEIRSEEDSGLLK